ncbi:hypothetical protein LA345_13435 [Burkholderia vietnamiensis]|uniref:Lipoprotein n=1 Tax=Burkholderia vietnamiensis (strain G4 / LMG 22486) TaxID=269482 RepID=A4JFV9_BURVG|nr:hypothetical protein Bcep1808_2160 [Burkholderia vietnamiensis G4]MCB4344916.1 hypothetical protein [Burkholderia vietnamiensis]
MSTLSPLLVRLRRRAALPAIALIAALATPAMAQNAAPATARVSAQTTARVSAQTSTSAAEVAVALPNCGWDSSVLPSGVALGPALVYYHYHLDNGPDWIGQEVICPGNLMNGRSLNTIETLLLQAQIAREHPERKDVVIPPDSVTRGVRG